MNVEESDSPNTHDSSETETMRTFWSRKLSDSADFEDVCELFLSLVFEDRTYKLLNDKTTTKKDVWERIAKAMDDLGLHMPVNSLAEAANKCASKFRNLAKDYKKYLLKTTETGGSYAEPCAYFNVIHPYFKLRADLNPQNIKNSRKPVATNSAPSNESVDCLKFADNICPSTSAFSRPSNSQATRNILSVNSPSVAVPKTPELVPKVHNSSKSTPASATSFNSTPSSVTFDTGVMMEPDEEYVMENPHDVVLPPRTPSSSKTSSTSETSSSDKPSSSRHTNVKKRLKPRATTTNHELMTFMQKTEQEDREFRKKQLEIQEEEMNQGRKMIDILNIMVQLKREKRPKKSSKKRRKGSKENVRIDSSSDSSSDSD
nr:PREDICTED: uncharacterized protein LOC109035960 [Bemisia tabaci]